MPTRIPANARQSTNAVAMLGQRLQRWPKIKPALAHYVVRIRVHGRQDIDQILP